MNIGPNSPFADRLHHAAQVISREPREIGRALRYSLEAEDAPAMAAALYLLAESRPRLARLLPRYVLHPSQCGDCRRLVGLTLHQLEAEAAAMRARFAAHCASR